MSILFLIQLGLWFLGRIDCLLDTVAKVVCLGLIKTYFL